jgi:DNA-binding XRE family transcriptional regulator
LKRAQDPWARFSLHAIGRGCKVFYNFDLQRPSMSDVPLNTVSALTGSRLRARRVALGLKQGDVATRAGVSASYLNLIEHNRRRVPADVLAATLNW